MLVHSDGGGRSLVLQAIAQEDLRKEMARYMVSGFCKLPSTHQ